MFLKKPARVFNLFQVYKLNIKYLFIFWTFFWVGFLGCICLH